MNLENVRLSPGPRNSISSSCRAGANQLVHRHSSRLAGFAAILFLAVMLPTGSVAHEMRPAYLELREIDHETFDMLWKVPAVDPNQRPALRVVFPSDAKLFGTPRSVFVNNATIERSRVQRRGGWENASIRIDGLEATMTDVLVRVQRLDGSTQVERLTPDRVEFSVKAGQGKIEVIRTYLGLGVEHIMLGIDHLLFVLALLILVKGWRRLLGTITSFTVAHSITLALATLGFMTVSGPPVEAIIALSIVFVAMEIIHGRQGRPGLTERQPWIVAFTFGLLHGLGFAGALHEVGLPQAAIPLALLFFNVGVEVGQLIFVTGVLAFLAIVRRSKMDIPRWMEWVPPYAIGGLAMFWVIERTLAF